MNKAQFNDLLKRYERGQVTERERTLLEEWAKLISKDKDLVDVSPEVGEEIKQALLARIEEEQKVKPLFPQWVKIAATIALLAIASFTVWKLQGTDMVNIQTLAQTQKAILPDGSIVWLKENSTLAYPEKFKGDTRSISFTGEALFEIAKDAAHPCVIQSGALTATVLGTSFTIKATEANIEVVVLTGKVSLASATTHQKIIVLPNEKASFKKADEYIEKTVTQEQEVTEAAAHPEYNMRFDATRMDEVIRKIEAKFNVKVSIAHDGLNNCQLTADLTDQSLTSTLDKITKVFALRYERNGNTITLTGGQGCNN